MADPERTFPSILDQDGDTIIPGEGGGGGSGDLLADGSVPMTADFNVNNQGLDNVNRIEMGVTGDSTIERVSPGVISVEGDEVVTVGGDQTITSGRIEELALVNAEAITISANNIKPNQSSGTIDTSGPASEDINTITSPGTGGKDRIYLWRAASGSRTPVFKNGVSILCSNGIDIALDDTSKVVMGVYDQASDKFHIIPLWQNTGAGSGDMLAAVYDPGAVAGDAFDMDNMVEGAATKILTDLERTKLSGVEDNATEDQTDAEIETAYNNEVPKVSAPEISAGIEAAVRRYSPADVKSFVDTHGGGSGDMLAATYDPTSVSGDAFDMDNMVEGTTNKILNATQKGALDGTNGVPSSGNPFVTDSDPRNTNDRNPTAHTHPASEISDASANGRSLITAANYAAMRTLLNVADGATANIGDMVGSNNLSDVGSAVTAFNTIKQIATGDATGVIELATQIETDAGTDDSRAITPSTLSNYSGFASSAQGALADSATQPGDDADTLGSGAATDGQVLTADGAGNAAWEAATGGSSPTTTQGDVIVRGVSEDERLALGSNGQVLQSNGTTAVWGTVSSGGVASGYGEIRVSGNATETTISSASTDFTNAVQVTVFDTNGESNADATPDHTNDHITVNTTSQYLISATVSFSGPGNDTYSFAFFKNNGATQIGGRVSRKLGTGGDVGAFGMSAVATLTATDTIEIWVQNEADTSNLTVEDATLVVAGLTSADIADNSITLAKLADMATDSFLGRDTAGTGDPEVLSAATAKSILAITASDISDVNASSSDVARANHTGTQLMSTISDAGALATLGSVGSAQIDDEAVTLAKLAHMATDSFLGRDTAGTGDPEVLTAAQAKTILAISAADISDVEAGATADQTGAEIKTAYEGENFAANSILGNNVGADNPPVELSVAQVQSMLNVEDGSTADQTAKNSVEIDAGEIQLTNDSATPGNNQVYGTNGSGVRGWKADPAGGSGDLWSDPVDANIVPDGNDTRDIGSAANGIAELYLAGGLVIDDRADHPITPATGFGQLWIRTSDNKLIYTDEAGTDTDLTAGGGGGSNIQDFSATFDGAGEEIVVGMRSNFHRLSGGHELQGFTIICWTDEFRTAIDTAAVPAFKVMTAAFSDPTSHTAVTNYASTDMVVASGGKKEGSTASVAMIDADDYIFIECVTTGGAKLVDITLEYAT